MMKEPIRAIAPFVARADELARVEPVVSYWLRLYAVQKALSASERSPELERRLGELMTQLEQAKIEHGKAVTDMTTAKQAFESFALRVFDNADRETRAQRADMGTSKKFLAAAVFLEACAVFGGEPSKDIADRRKYAKVQAFRIQGAIVAGKDPNAGAPAAATTDVIGDTPAEQDQALEAEFAALSAKQAPTGASDAEDSALSATALSRAYGVDEDLSAQPDTQPSSLDRLADLGSPPAALPTTEIDDAGPTASNTAPAPASPLDHLATLPTSPPVRPVSPAPPALMSPSEPYPTPPPAPVVPPAAVFQQPATVPAPPRQLVRAEPAPLPISMPEPPADVELDTAGAVRHARFAISALDYEDIATAVKELRLALASLQAR